MAEVAAAVDNDVILKTVGFKLADRIWEPNEIGYLGAAPFVLEAAAAKPRIKDRSGIQERLRGFFTQQEKLEPTDEEEALAADLEFAAQTKNVDLDSGEALLVAIVLTRPIPQLATGDKRAIAALEELAGDVSKILELAGRVRCLEQLVEVIVDEANYEEIAGYVCAEPTLDTAFSMIFGCASGKRSLSSIQAGLESYIKDVREKAPTLMT